MAQTEDAWVYFTDKPSKKEFINTPLKMLTQRSLDRRMRYNIPLDFKDIPVEASYVLQIKNANGIKILARSKWLNALHVQGSQADITNLLENDFVSNVQFANTTLNSSAKSTNTNKIVHQKNKFEVSTDFDYGEATLQIEVLKGEILHQNNFTGKGMQIAVIDGGFPNVDTFSAFERIRNNNQILGGYDFVNRDSNFYSGHYHGMSVLSTIAGYVENEFVGTAPDAEFYLFISEDVDNETPLEESLWVEAAEKADSLGVDVINTSLGYTTFDNPNYNYSYQDMDGETTFISRGAEIAFSRGMIVVNAAGNEGDKPWHYISAPADANSVLSIGAVVFFGPMNFITPFSGFGPTYDGRIKPDVCAIGAFAAGIDASGNLTDMLFGTSFASPIMTGVVACLWQAFPEKTNAEITQLIKESAHLFLSPTDQEGYGIPNFETIFNLLNEETSGVVLDLIQPFPNPVENELNFKFSTTSEEVEVVVYNLFGQVISTDIISKLYPVKDVSYLAKGVYLVQLSYNEQTHILKIIKN